MSAGLFYPWRFEERLLPASSRLRWTLAILGVLLPVDASIRTPGYLLPVSSPGLPSVHPSVSTSTCPLFLRIPAILDQDPLKGPHFDVMTSRETLFP